jgi:lipopolysaccharide transport system ATP-binding protein
MSATRPILTVEALSKRYRLAHELPSDRLPDAVSAKLRGLWRQLRARRNTQEEFWALRDVSFEVGQGQVVGVIGRNGAGKSTLLKILSRITEPSAGRVVLRGRVASLLEVGTGFHQDLSGRENIYLNGAILGMTRAEIRRKFDEIVAFAEVERFLDTPVKRYSSGMYVRLAFAVAAHLEPEILIVDEVLAVGDQQFQQKCLGKMREVARGQGRTVLFVSHNLHAVRELCERAIFLQEGRLVTQGLVGPVLDAYAGAGEAGVLTPPVPTPEERARVYLSEFTLENELGVSSSHFGLGETWRARLVVRVVEPRAALVVAIGVCSSDGTAVQTCWAPPVAAGVGEHHYTFTQDAVRLAAGSYRLIFGVSDGGRSLQQVELGRFDVSTVAKHGYFACGSGVGAVLNSMRVAHRAP